MSPMLPKLHSRGGISPSHWFGNFAQMETLELGFFDGSRGVLMRFLRGSPSKNVPFMLPKLHTRRLHEIHTELQ